MHPRLVATIEKAPFEFCRIDYAKAVANCTETPEAEKVPLSLLLTPQGEVDFDQHEKDHLRSLNRPDLYEAPVQNLKKYPVVVKVENRYILYWMEIIV
jgi:folate-binding Fe-S cluster repair protein YgfZ